MINKIEDIRIGTSGWTYDWNPDGFDWFVRKSRLNSVELNMSFYRFPFKNMVRSWARKTPEDFVWSIKVHQSITHKFKFSGRSLEVWNAFKKRFEELSKRIRYFLFQLPPNFRPKGKLLENLEWFINEVNLGEMFVLEWRNEEWFSEEWIKWAKSLGITLCTVDAPELPRIILKSTNHIYVRFHGRAYWYSHEYTTQELKEVVSKIISARPKYIAIYFNNNHYMLDNALETKRLLEELLRNENG
ncbi:MAG: DUF72 domain-containing protein [Candidatus Asgardarchaeia archaeon]